MKKCPRDYCGGSLILSKDAGGIYYHCLLCCRDFDLNGEPRKAPLLKLVLEEAVNQGGFNEVTSS